MIAKHRRVILIKRLFLSHVSEFTSRGRGSLFNRQERRAGQVKRKSEPQISQIVADEKATNGNPSHTSICAHLRNLWLTLFFTCLGRQPMLQSPGITLRGAIGHALKLKDEDAKSSKITILDHRLLRDRVPARGQITKGDGCGS